jgi:hypothetical protein
MRTVLVVATSLGTMGVAETFLWFLVEDRVKLAAYRWLGRHPRRGADSAGQRP